MSFEFPGCRNGRSIFVMVFRSVMVLFVLLAYALPGQASATSTAGYDRPLKSASELDYPPFAIVRKDGTADGFSVELLTEVVWKPKTPSRAKQT